MSSDPSQSALTRNIGGDSRIVGPVLQFSLFIIPLVMNCFFIVYALAGWVIDGRDKRNWSLEAPTVGLWVCVGMLIYCVLVLAFVRLRGGTRWHPLSVSSVFHIVTALLLCTSIYVTVNL